MMNTHETDLRCVCTDGREAERDVTEMCDSRIEARQHRHEYREYHERAGTAPCVECGATWTWSERIAAAVRP
jgi:hypothetical protein